MCFYFLCCRLCENKIRQFKNNYLELNVSISTQHNTDAWCYFFLFLKKDDSGLYCMFRIFKFLPVNRCSVLLFLLRSLFAVFTIIFKPRILKTGCKGVRWESTLPLCTEACATLICTSLPQDQPWRNFSEVTLLK